MDSRVSQVVLYLAGFATIRILATCSGKMTVVIPALTKNRDRGVVAAVFLSNGEAPRKLPTPSMALIVPEAI
jgi:hypothetical protein